MRKDKTSPGVSGVELLKQMREDSGSKKHIDQEKVQLRKDAETIIRKGTLDDFIKTLRLAGVDPESAKGKGLIDRFIALSGPGRFPR